ncbi:tRNA-splicing endonuclease subunit sen54 [Malassezia furfur]|uniref:tRNA-splicing endonuclease subunit sen54 n=1 Tax=Malassezia furfur TaxID=55194 RepID=A0ABY8ETJ9_MALFU|nr:tRNA-splicing endonuclease subunit sen54 [Malassezia furfur]
MADDAARHDASDAEEDMPDYRVLAALAQRHKPGAEAPVIPKRGEKDFEPTGFGGQSKALALSRDALFSAIRTERAHSSKTLSTATWDPVLHRAFVFVQRGQSCTHIGATQRRTLPDGRTATHLELFPEEAVYLIERGALDCRINNAPGTIPTEAAHASCLPLSVAQAYAQLLGHDGATLARYQIYAYLKRLGYIVQRADLVDQVRAQAASKAPTAAPPAVWSRYPKALGTAARAVAAAVVRAAVRLLAWLAARVRYLVRLVAGRTRRGRGLLRLDPGATHDAVFAALQIVPTEAPGGAALERARARAAHLAPFFYAWRPATHFKRTQPPPPEFRICVLETDRYPMLHLHDFEVLFSHVPLPARGPGEALDAGASADEQELQAIREQNRRAYGKPRRAPGARPPKPGARAQPGGGAAPATLVARLAWALRVLAAWVRRIGVRCGAVRAPKKPVGNVYLPLKAGRCSVVVAIVDQGTMSLLRFGEAEFARWRLAGA